jgi:hypothetical protein
MPTAVKPKQTTETVLEKRSYAQIMLT